MIAPATDHGASGGQATDVATWRGGTRSGPRRLAGGIGLSAALHVAVIAGFVLHRPAPRPPSPPVYRVDLVAAPPGAPAIGTVAPPPPAGEPAPAAPAAPEPVKVAPTPPKAVERPAPAPPRPETRPRAMPLPSDKKTKPAPPVATPVPPSKTKPPATKTPEPAKTPPKAATPTKSPTPPPKAATPAKVGQADGKAGATGPTGPRAAGGAEGGRGADVANVHIAGLQFPYPGYLQNIVRQVRLRFAPSARAQALQADVAFLIHQDGSVSDVRVVRKSGDYGFDLEARGAIESAGQARAFGALPDGFGADVLPVTFSFDPSVIR